jgi:hypothetical protein
MREKGRGEKWEKTQIGNAFSPFPNFPFSLLLHLTANDTKDIAKTIRRKRGKIVNRHRKNQNRRAAKSQLPGDNASKPRKVQIFKFDDEKPTIA